MRFFLLFTFLNLSSFSQNLIKNGGFEILTEPLGFYDCNSSIASGGGNAGDQRCFPFYYNKVPNWVSYSYSAEIITNTVYPGLTGNAGVFGFITTTSTGTPTFYEGIFQMRDGKFVNNIYTRDKIFKKGKIYLVSFRFMFSNGTFGVINPTIKVIAGNSFVEDRNLPNSVALNNLNDLNNEVIGLPSFLKNQFNSDIKKPNYIN